MGDIIRFKKGLKDNLPILGIGEPGFTTNVDDQRLYIGGPNGNVAIPNMEDIDIINSQMNEKAKKYYIDVMYPPEGYAVPAADGITDDSTVINNLIIYCIKNNYDLYIPRGTYRCNLKINYNDIFDYVPTWEDCEIDFKIFGDGDRTKIYNDNGTLLDIESYPKSEKYFRFVRIEDLYFLGGGTEEKPSNTLGLKITRIQHLIMKNIRFIKCGGGAYHFYGVYDVNGSNIDVLYCGHVTSDTDYAYAIQYKNAYKDDGITLLANTNAVKFTNLRVEKAPCMFYVDGDCKENYFVNCKFEKGCVNNLETHRPIYIKYTGDLNFVNCFFCNNQQTFNSDTIINNEGYKYFIVSEILENRKSSIAYSERVKFTNCDFTSSSGFQASSWIKGTNISLINCTINGGMGYGGADYPSPILLLGNCVMDNCSLSTSWSSRTLEIGGSHNKVDIFLSNKLANLFSQGFVKIQEGATYNTINLDIEIIGNGKSLDDLYLFETPTTFNKIINGSSIVNLNTNIIQTSNHYITTKNVANGLLTCSLAEMIFIQNASIITGIQHTYDGYKCTLISLGSITIKTGGNLKLKDSADKTLSTDQSITFIFKDGYGYEI